MGCPCAILCGLGINDGTVPNPGPGPEPNPCVLGNFGKGSSSFYFDGASGIYARVTVYSPIMLETQYAFGVGCPNGGLPPVPPFGSPNPPIGR